MDQSLITLITKQILETVRDKLSARLAEDIEAGHQNDKGTLEIITSSLDKYLSELPKMEPPKHTYTPVSSVPNHNTPAPQTSNGTVAPASNAHPATIRPASRTVASDVCKDEKGNVIKCEAVVKKTAIPCKNNAKFHIGNQYLCGLHVKSVNGAQPDASKKLTAGTSKAPARNTSSFGTAVGITSTSNYNNFAIDVTDDIPQVADDEGEETA